MLVACLSICAALLVTPDPGPGTRAGTVETSAPALSDTGAVTAAPDPQARAGVSRRILLGQGYRDLWAITLSAHVVEASAYSRGAAPLDSADHGAALVLTAADSSVFLFRPLAHAPSTGGLGPGAFATNWLARDEESAWHPAGRLVAGALYRAIGVLPESARLAVFPRDTTLGDLGGEFAGRLGTLERLPRAATGEAPGYPAGTIDVVRTPELLARLKDGPADRVDAHAYLTARLADFLLGGTGAAPQTWTWSGCATGADTVWRPVPLLPARAFPRLGGVLRGLPREALPARAGRTLTGPPGGDAAAHDATDALDRRLLAALDRSAWASVAAGLATRLSDAVLDSVAAAVPAEMGRKSASNVRAALRQRRDELVHFAASEYARLNETVNVWGSTRSSSVVVASSDARHLDVTMAERATPGADVPAPWFHRRLDAADTRELRLYLAGADTRVVLRGTGGAPIAVRVVSDASGTEVADSSRAGELHVYTTGAPVLASGPGRFRVERLADPGSRSPAGLPDEGRDSGERSGWKRVIAPGSDRGLLVGWRFDRETYGFEQRPFASRTALSALYSLGLHGAEIALSHDRRRANSRLSGGVQLRVSGLDVSRFYGFGNSTPDTAARRGAYDVSQSQIQLLPYAAWSVGARTYLRLALPLKLVRTAVGAQEQGSVLDAVRPYGMGSFREAGAQIGLLRNGDPAAPGSEEGRPRSERVGLGGRLLASYFPAAGSPSAGFGVLEGDAVTRFELAWRGAPRLSLRAGGKRAWGRYPFFEAAFLGGSGELPGTREQRYAGDASLSGASELHLRMWTLRGKLAGEIGVLGLADAGRVFLAGENAPTWHGVTGMGLWYAPRGGRESFTVALVNAGGRSHISTRGGFNF